MPFKKNEDGSLAQADSGLPIFVGPDGSEKPYDPDQKATQIAELTERAAKRKDALEKAQASLALLGDVEDIGAFVTQAKANAETVASLADKERDTEAAVQKRIRQGRCDPRGYRARHAQSGTVENHRRTAPRSYRQRFSELAVRSGKAQESSPC